MLTNNLLQGRGGGATTGDSFILVMHGNHRSPEAGPDPRQPLQRCSIEFDRFFWVCRKVFCLNISHLQH